MSRRLATLGAGLLLAAAAAGQAQTIKPLDVERDGNGVDLLSGRIATPLPVLSIPAAPNLRFQRLQDLLPYLNGRLQAGLDAPATYDINTGSSTSENFSCNNLNECTSRKRHGSALDANPGAKEFTYYEGGTGREIRFDLHNGPQGPLTPSSSVFGFYASTVRYPSGETLTFAYDSATTSAGHVFRRPIAVASTVGYTLTLAYQGNAYDQPGWSVLRSATIHVTGSATPLARLTYAGDTVTDLGGRTWTCAPCANSRIGQSQTNATALRLPGEPADTLRAQAETRTYHGTTHNNWVTRVTRDGVDWTYSYQAHSSQPTSRITRVAIAGPNGFARTVNVANGPDVRPHVTSIVDSQGRETAYAYDDHQRVTDITYPELNSVHVVYDLIGNIVERRQRPKPVSFDLDGQPTADIVESAYFGTTTGCHLPGCFRPLWTRDARRQQTDYVWDQQTGDLLVRTEPADANGRRRRTTSSWSFGRLTAERICLLAAPGFPTTCGTAAEQVREIDYRGGTPLPERETLTDALGTASLVTRHHYDPAGRLLWSDGPLEGEDDRVHYRYDQHGRRIWEIGARGANNRRPATFTLYRDSDDKPVSRETGTLPDENATVLTPLNRADILYDQRRNPMRETVSSPAPGGGATIHGIVQRTFDLSNRLECEAVRVNPAAYAALPASACALGAQGTGGNDHGPDRITRNGYDTEGRLLRVERSYGTPLQQIYASYTYSPNGQRTRVVDANYNRAELTYDGHDRQRRWIFPGAGAGAPNQCAAAGVPNPCDYEEYGYDAAGNRTSLRKRDGSVLAFTYDNLGRMIGKQVPERAGLDPAHTRDVHYGYDAGNRQTFARFDSPTGQGVTNAYDNLGRLASTIIDLGGTSRTLSYLYDQGGRRARITHPDGTQFRYQYDAAGNPTYLTTPADWLVNASYNAAGLPSVISRINATWSGRYYDPLGRLTGLDLQPIPSSHGVAWNHALNPAGQIWRTIRNHNDAYAYTGAYDVSRPYTVNRLNQYRTAGPATFAHDANGNLTSDGATTFTYDVENRLVAASGAHNAQLRYDPLGRLWQVTSGTNTTRFLYDGDALVAEYNLAGAIQRRYAHWVGADVPVIEYIGATTTSPRHLFANHLGSIVAATGAGAAMLYRNTYDEWGIPGAANQGRFQYTGQAFLPELGLYHYKARVYSPTLGRFLQTDPVGYEDQINLYTYVENDPINHTDPTGMCVGPLIIPCGIAAKELVVPGLVIAVGAMMMSDGPGDVPARSVSRPQLPVRHRLQSINRTQARSIPNVQRARGGIVVYRLYGGRSGPYGPSWTTVDPRTDPNFRQNLGLPRTNTAQLLATGILTDFTGVRFGRAAPLHGQPGGGPELDIPNPAEQIEFRQDQPFRPGRPSRWQMEDDSITGRRCTGSLHCE